MDDIFPRSLYEQLLDNYTVRGLLSCIPLNLNCGHIQDFWNDADDYLFFYAKFNEVERPDDEYRVFALAEYITYIPYGDDGFDFFDEYIRAQKGISAAEWRLNAFLRACGPAAEKLNEAQIARLKKFFEGRYLTQVHYDDIDEVAIANFRLRHRAEAAVKRYYEFSDAVSDLVFDFADSMAEKRVMPVDELLNQLPAPPPLGQSERDFIIATAQLIDKLSD